MKSTRPPTYALYRVGRSGTKFTVLQLRAVNGGSAVNAADLAAYAVVRPVQTPWWKITIGAGSRMLLADDAAGPLLAEGMITPLLSETLVPWRPAYDADRAAKHDARKRASVIRNS